MLLVLGALGAMLRLSWPFYAGLACAAGFAGWHWALIRTRTREGCFKAFMRSNWIGAAIFAGIAFSFPIDGPWR